MSPEWDSVGVLQDRMMTSSLKLGIAWWHHRLNRVGWGLGTNQIKAPASRTRAPMCIAGRMAGAGSNNCFTNTVLQCIFHTQFWSIHGPKLQQGEFYCSSKHHIVLNMNYMKTLQITYWKKPVLPTGYTAESQNSVWMLSSCSSCSFTAENSKVQDILYASCWT